MQFRVFEALHYLSRLRSEGRIMRALAERFPSEDLWVAFMLDPELQEELDCFLECFDELQDIAGDQGLSTIAQVHALANPEFDRALEALSTTAEKLGLDPNDLMVVLMGL